MSRTRPPAASTWNGRASWATWNQAWPRSGAGAAAGHRTQPPMRCPHRVRRCCRPPAAPRAVHRCCAGHCVPATARVAQRQPSAPLRLHWPAATAGGGAVRSGAAPADLRSARAARPARRARRHPTLARRPAAGARPAHGADRPAASAAGLVAGVPAAGLHCTGSPSATPAWPDAARVRTWSWLWPAAPRTGAPSCCDNGGRDLPTAIAAHRCSPCWCCWINSAARSTCLPTRLLEIPSRAAISRSLRPR